MATEGHSAGSCPQGILRGEGDGVDDPVEFPQRSARSSATASMSSGLFTSSSRTGFRVEASGRSLGETSGAAEAAKDDLRAPAPGSAGPPSRLSSAGPGHR